jgi:GT2 family glycosyltransferase
MISKLFSLMFGGALRFGVRLLERYPVLANRFRVELLNQADSLFAVLSDRASSISGLESPVDKRTINWAKAVFRTGAEVIPSPEYMSGDPKVSMVISSRDGAKHLRRLLSSFSEYNSYPNYEFVVVTQGSTDETNVILDFFSETLPIRVLNNGENQSFSVASNAGAKLATGEILIFCNNEVEFGSDVLKDFVQSFATDEVSIVGVRQASIDKLTGNESVWHVGVAFDWDPLLEMLKPSNISDLRNQSPDDTLLRTWAVSGGFLGVRAGDFWELEGFATDYDSGYEDVDLCIRSLRDLGKVVLVDTECLVYNSEPSSRNDSQPEVTSRKRLRNSSALKRSVGGYVEEYFLKNRFAESSAMLDFNPRLAFLVSSTLESRSGHGDPLVAASLGKWLERKFAWSAILVPEHDWYQSPAHVDMFIAMRPDFQPSLGVFSPMTLGVSWIRNRMDHWLQNPHLRSFDLHLISSIKGKKEFEKASGLQAELFRIAVDTEIFSFSKHEPDRTIDILITENYWGSKREFHDWVPGHANQTVRVLGRGWGTSSAPARLAKHWAGYVDYPDLANEYSSSKIVIDDSTKATKSWGMLNMRVFEAIQSGALVLTNDRDGLYEIFEDKLPSWASTIELTQLVSKYLADEEARNKLLTEARQILLDSHTFESRSAEFSIIIRRVFR